MCSIIATVLLAFLDALLNPTMSRLQSADVGERLAAVDGLKLEELMLVAYGEATDSWHDKSLERKYANYSVDVRERAVMRICEKADWDSLMLFVQEMRGCADGTASLLYGKLLDYLCTKDNLDKLCNSYAAHLARKCYFKYNPSTIKNILLGMNCWTNDYFYVYAVSHRDDSAIRDVVGERDLLGNVKSGEALFTIVFTPTVDVKTRVRAAVKVFDNYSITKDGTLQTLSQFTDDEERLSKVATAALNSARRFGNEDVLLAIQEKVIGNIKETAARAKARAGRQFVLNGYYVGMEEWRANLLSAFFNHKGVSFSTSYGVVSKFTFGREFFDAQKEYAFGNVDYETWVTRFQRATSSLKNVRAQKDENGFIAIRDDDTIIKVMRKGGMVAGITLESKAQNAAELKASATKVALMSAVAGALLGSGGNVGSGGNNVGQMAIPMQGGTTISTAKQNGRSVDVYDANGNWLFSRTGVLQGYTSDGVSIRNNGSVDVYDAKGNWKFGK